MWKVSIATEKGLRLEFSDNRPSLSEVAEINAALAEIGAGVWPLDLSGAPDDIQRLLLDNPFRYTNHFSNFLRRDVLAS